MTKKFYAVEDINMNGRLIPKGQYDVPWYVLYLRHSKYPSFGRHLFMEHISDEDRNKLWDVYELGGEEALYDVAKLLDDTVWLARYRQERFGSMNRGRDWLDSV